MLQCLGMCLDMLLQVYVTVSRYVFGYVVTGLCYSVGRYVFVYTVSVVWIQVYVTVYRYVFGYVVTGLC